MLRTQADLAEAVENFEGCSGIVLTKSLVVAHIHKSAEASIKVAVARDGCALAY